jgi:hypothetical protein
MTRRVTGVALVILLFTVGGCLQKETTHTLYLEPGGAVTWTALEQDVRSDKDDPASRLAEENDYLSAVSAGTHDSGQALATLGAIFQDVRLTRQTRPFTVVTEARFTAIEQVVNRILLELRVPGEATVTRANGTTTLRVHVDVTSVLADERGEETPVSALLGDFDHFRVVLTDGRFVDATGFRLSPDGTVAVPIDRSEDDLARQEGVIDVSLTWAPR